MSDQRAQTAALIEIADKAEAARQRAAQAQQAGDERLRLAQLEAAKDEARKLQAVAVAEQMAQAANLALAAGIESQRIAAMTAQAAVAATAQLAAVKIAEAQQMAQATKLAEDNALAAKLEAAKVAEVARQRVQQAQLAAAQAARLVSLRAEQDKKDRLLVEQAESLRVEAEREAQLQQLVAQALAAEQQTLRAQASALAQPATLEPTPFFKGYNEHLRKYTVGDEFNIRVIDQFTKASKPLLMKVTQVDANADLVTYNEGEFVSDLMGNIATNQRGAMSTPRQFYPAELFVGKKWQTRFKQARYSGITYTFTYALKVVAKERVTVPAGTFDCYKIEARGFNVELGASVDRDIWVATGVNADIAHEIRVRLRNGTWEQNDRQELVSYVQSQ